jgi:hypothetical protein
MSFRRAAARLVAVLLLLPVTAGRAGGQPASSDLDAFMGRVLARRDDNWKRVQQYVLDERERVEVFGPARERIYGLNRDFTWYMRDGVFVRSPLRVNGAAVDERERRNAEASWIAGERAREARKGNAAAEPVHPAGANDLDTVLQFAREPHFVSMAYFLKFRFEPGHYAFVGPEQFNGVRVLRVEYYPERLFRGDRDEHADPSNETHEDTANETEARINRQMNKTALVTLWIEPSHEQIVQYTFENIGMDFLPGRAIVRVDGVSASMQMNEAFPGVWLPHRITGRGEATLATGTYRVNYDLEYHDYRQADVKSKVIVR